MGIWPLRAIGPFATGNCLFPLYIHILLINTQELTSISLNTYRTCSSSRLYGISIIRATPVQLLNLGGWGRILESLPKWQPICSPYWRLIFDVHQLNLYITAHLFSLLELLLPPSKGTYLMVQDIIDPVQPYQ